MLRTREMGFSPNPAVYISPPCQESRKLKTKILNLVGQMSHDDQLDWSSVHIITREKIIHLRKAGEVHLCRLFSTALFSAGSHPPCYTVLKCWCLFPAETYSVRSVCWIYLPDITYLQASLCPGTR